jgi:integrase
LSFATRLDGASQARGQIALRSLLRFLFQTGQVETDIAASVPTVAAWRLATIPKYISPGNVQRLLDTCPRDTRSGRRNYAILLLLARLGLRAGDVAALELDDIEWRTGSCGFALRDLIGTASRSHGRSA